MIYRYNILGVEDKDVSGHLIGQWKSKSEKVSVEFILMLNLNPEGRELAFQFG